MSKSVVGVSTPPALFKSAGKSAWSRGPPRSLATSSNVAVSNATSSGNSAPAIGDVDGKPGVASPLIPESVSTMSPTTTNDATPIISSANEPISPGSLLTPDENSTNALSSVSPTTSSSTTPTASMEPPPRPRRNPLRRESSSGASFEPMKSQTAAVPDGSDSSLTPPVGDMPANSSSSAPTSWASFLSQAKTHPPVSTNSPSANPEMKRTRSNRSRRRDSSTDTIKTDTIPATISVPNSTAGFTLPPMPFTLPPLPSHPPPLPPVPPGPPPTPPTSAKTSKLQADAAPFIPPTLLSTRKSSAIVIKNSKGQEVDLRQLSTTVPPTPITAGIVTSDPSIFVPPASIAVKIESEEERRRRVEADTLRVQVHDPTPPHDQDGGAEVLSPSTTHDFTDVAPASTDSAIDGEESEEEDDDWAAQKVDVPTFATSPPTAPLDGSFASISAFPSSPSTTAMPQTNGPPPAPPTRPRRERSRRGSKRGDSANRPDTTAMAGGSASTGLSGMTRTRSQGQGQGMTRTRSGAGNSRLPADGNTMTRTRSSGPVTRTNESATLGASGSTMDALGRTRSSEPRKRPAPGRLDLSGLPKPGGLSSGTMATALFNAKFIKLGEMEYPEGIEGPKEANAGLVYDRDFLLQFRSYCTERPQGMEEHEEVTLAQPIELPPQPTRTRSRRRRSTRTDIEPPSGFPLASASLAVPQSAGLAGTPITDEPISVGTIPATPLSATMPPVSMNVGRTSSRGGRSRNGSNASKLTSLGPTGTSNLPPMIRSVSHGSTRVTSSSATGTGLASLPLLSTMDRRSRSQKSRKRSASTRNEPPLPPTPALGDDIKPLEISANRWMPSSASLKPSSSLLGVPEGRGVDQVSQELVEKKVKGLLNKLTLEKFDTISDQIISWANQSESETDGQTLQFIIRLVFDKATDEAAWSAMYASLCKKMMEQISSRVADEGVRDKHGQPVVGGQLFRVYLLSRCQADFERGWSTRETLEEQQFAAVAAAEEAHGVAPGEVVFSDEYYALQKAKRRGLGLVKFIGELFKLTMLTERIMHRCILKLLDEPAEDDIESVCQLLKTVGAALSGAKGKESMDMYFGRMRELSQDASISQRIRFMLLDVIDLRAHNWISKNQVAAPTTLAAVHEAAEKEANEKSSSSSRPIPIARNTSRRGQNRSETSAPKDDAWGLTGASRSFSKGLGASLSSTLSSTPRTEEFIKSPSIKSPASTGPIHSLARLTSEPGSSRMTRQLSESGKSRSRRGGQDRQVNRRTSVDFDHLDAAVEAGSSGRKRLQLLPRSVGAATAGSAEEEPPIEMSSSLISTDEEPPSMSKGQARAKVEEDVKEFLQIRDLEEATGYFEALPSNHRHLLVDKFVSKIDSKESDIILIAELFSKVSSAGICSNETFEQGFAPAVEALDDIALDVPSAYNVMGKLLAASRLRRDMVDQLAGTINVYGQVLVHPRDKLMKAYDNAV